jgi:hypothetical protein
MAETRRKFDQDFRKARCGWCGSAKLTERCCRTTASGYLGSLTCGREHLAGARPACRLVVLARWSFVREAHDHSKCHRAVP